MERFLGDDIAQNYLKLTETPGRHRILWLANNMIKNMVLKDLMRLGEMQIMIYLQGFGLKDIFILLEYQQ